MCPTKRPPSVTATIRYSRTPCLCCSNSLIESHTYAWYGHIQNSTSPETHIGNVCCCCLLYVRRRQSRHIFILPYPTAPRFIYPNSLSPKNLPNNFPRFKPTPRINRVSPPWHQERRSWPPKRSPASRQTMSTRFSPRSTPRWPAKSTPPRRRVLRDEAQNSRDTMRNRCD